MILQAQIADDLLMQQAHRVAGGGVAKTGMELLGDRGTARDRRDVQTRRPSTRLRAR